MFGYVLPPLEELPQEERDRFRGIYCGLCHTLSRLYGPAARLILNYDFTFLAMLLSDGVQEESNTSRCPVSPVKKRPYQPSDPAMELAAGESVILAYWQMRDGVADHNFRQGFKYRILSMSLRSAYRKAARTCADFDAATREQLRRLRELETAHNASMDEAADTFATLLAAAADAAPEENRRRVLRQMLYHLGRWIYLVDAADDLRDDWAEGNYNPLALRYGLTDGTWSEAARREFAATLDHSIHMTATAFELWDFGCWTEILKATVYTGLFRVGKAVLDGTFQSGPLKKKKDKIVEESV